MGRPISKGILAKLELSSAWVPGDNAAISNAVIVKQKGTNKYLALNPSTGNTGIVALTNGTVTAAGQAFIAGTVFGTNATEYARVVLRHEVKTFLDNVYRWNATAPASQVGDITLPLTALVTEPSGD
jgi:hypothetical protein